MYDKPPNRIPWPPIIYLGALLLSFVLGRFWQMISLDFPIYRQVGAGLIVAAIVLDIYTMLAFRRHRTTIMPHKAASHLIRTGPFGHTRNPIYLANTVLLLGVGLAFDLPWAVILSLPAAYLTQKLAIEREERHLAEKFGEAWTSYEAKVPRWLFRL